MYPESSQNHRITTELLECKKLKGSSQGVIKRCHLSWLTNRALVYEPKCEGGEGGCGISANEYSCAHGAKINFGDLTPYLTYDNGTTVKVNFMLHFIFTKSSGIPSHPLDQGHNGTLGGACRCTNPSGTAALSPIQDKRFKNLYSRVQGTV